MINKETFMEWYQQIVTSSTMDLAINMNVPMEFASVILPAAVIYRRLIEELGADTIWLPGIQLTDGIAYDYGEKNKIIRTTHDFDNDIVMAAKNMAKRYGSGRQHTQSLIALADTILDSKKKAYNLSQREKLLLQIAVLLHDCGKYISLVNVAECSYNIIMSTEIIGLSHKEREIIAHVVKFNTSGFEYYHENQSGNVLSIEDYRTVSKLTAILKLVNALDRSHMQKVQNLRAAVKDGQLILNIEYTGNFTLEQGLFHEKTELFKEVFSIEPVLKLKRRI